MGDTVVLSNGQLATMMDNSLGAIRTCKNVDTEEQYSVYAHDIMFVVMEYGREAIVHTRTQLLIRDQVRVSSYQSEDDIQY